MTEIKKKENIEINQTEILSMTTEPEIEINDFYYNCSECSSLIEILSINIDNNIIEFKCLSKDNKHKKK